VANQASIWFITPAWQRYELTAVCLEQRRRVIEALAGQGIEGRCVVIADDENLDIARGLGFDVVERDNDGLGRKVNDGYEYAAGQGATWLVFIGSDSWIDPAYLAPLPTDGAAIVRSSPAYCAVTPDRLALLRVTHPTNPAGPHLFHRDLLARAAFRPVADDLMRHIDSRTNRALSPFRWSFRDVHPLQYIGFRAPPMITRYDALWNRWGIAEYPDPWALLAEHYPADLVAAARKVIT
jgi:glycosyltransferase involved in cell wall biosynthesis